MLNLVRRVLRRLRLLPPAAPRYTIGNVKHHNSLVDSLVPQFVRIGDNFISAPGSVILAHDASLLWHTGSYRIEETVIGDNVFLGANAVILPGVTVGDGAIIGAGSVVTKDVPPATVVAGNPARILSTVDEYIARCRDRGVLIEAPASFAKIFAGERLDDADLAALQQSALEARRS